MVEITDITEEEFTQQPTVQETVAAPAEESAPVEETEVPVEEEEQEAEKQEDAEAEEAEENEEEEEEEENDDDYETTDDEEEDEDFDYFDEDETLLDRLTALKDIIPPQQRATISSVFEAVTGFSKTAFSKGSSLTWAITTSALLLGVPLSLTILAEQQLIEMEKQFQLQGDANELLGGSPTEQPATV